MIHDSFIDTDIIAHVFVSMHKKEAIHLPITEEGVFSPSDDKREGLKGEGKGAGRNGFFFKGVLRPVRHKADSSNNEYVQHGYDLPQLQEERRNTSRF